MSYNIAVASSDGKVVNQHFGRATKFLVFEIQDGKSQLNKIIETSPFCNHGGHDQNDLLSAIEALKGSRAVVVSQIGSGAENTLKNNGIDVFCIHDFIEVALERLSKYYTKIEQES
ncbi:MAG: NifB/NifX family molybdenum-iron cluster-binding protein [Bacillota bacterium]|nr:NifB/NifX family molybdenum-iron cluster-binding protein [Bacillota bacterium]